MILIKAEYRVEAKGHLMPVHRQAVYAPWDGDVEELFVSDGARVKEGQPLLRLRNDELRAQLESKTGELLLHQAERRTLLAQIDDAAKRAKRDDEIRLQGQLMELQARIRGVETLTAILTQRVERLTNKAPLSGVVTTFRVRELLNQRPAQRGEVLLEIADDSGEWRLELDVEEDRMGHVLRAQNDQRDPLHVEFVLATTPTETYTGSLQQIATRPKQLPEQGSLVEVYASIDRGQELNRRIGADVRAKIHCGERSLGYVWFGDVVEFVQRRWWW
jgi:multidrug efflux pump subunit AcrA (membrane-fusion protein)